MKACRHLPYMLLVNLSLPIFGMCQSVTNISHWVYKRFTPKVWLRHALTGRKIAWNSSKKSSKFFLTICHRSPCVHKQHRTCSTAPNGRADFWKLTRGFCLLLWFLLTPLLCFVPLPYNKVFPYVLATLSVHLIFKHTVLCWYISNLLISCEVLPKVISDSRSCWPKLPLAAILSLDHFPSSNTDLVTGIR